ncbi:MAG TPA: M23 family metallopeptidase [Gammaproteobacteria bacterium]|nr:M23 family metallopeptidase [Gammaproteobacteria bacterium]
MSPLVLLAAQLVALQGQVLQLELQDEPGLESATVSWRDHDVPFVRRDTTWLTVLGVDLDLAAGQHAADVELRYADGRTATRQQTIEVRGKDFPTTELTVEPKYVELSPEDQERSARESREIAALYAELTPWAYWSQPFASPIPGVAGGRNFGHRRVFNGKPRAPHSGADLKAATGDAIRAANTGRVVLAKDLFFSGNAVFIDHGLGVYTTYLHLSEILVEPGQTVERGQVIGLAGATGRVTGPHLHWGVRVLDARVDPFSLPGLGASTQN